MLEYRGRVALESTTDGRAIFRRYWINFWDEKGHHNSEDYYDIDRAIKRAIELEDEGNAELLNQLKQGYKLSATLLGSRVSNLTKNKPHPLPIQIRSEREAPGLKKLEVAVAVQDGKSLYHVLKISRRGDDIYCIPPHSGLHYSLHESGKGHFRPDSRGKGDSKEAPPIILMEGEAGTPSGDGIIRSPLSYAGRALCVCTYMIPISDLANGFRELKPKYKKRCVFDKSWWPEDTTWIRGGVWAVPENNEPSFYQSEPSIAENMLYKVADIEPQIWIFALPI